MTKIWLAILFLFLFTFIFAKSPHKDKLNLNCSICHYSNDSTKIRTDSFNHDVTKYILDGKHKSVACKKCHTDLNFSTTKNKCIDCHKDVHNNTASNDCELCHTTLDWKKIRYDHNQTAFSLKGQHQKLSCNQCHKNNFKETPTTCISCHSDDYNNSSNPNHIELKYSKECQVCHNSESWSKTTFDHSLYTKFKLVDSHASLTCNKCHTKGFRNTESACVSCHLIDYSNTKSLNHSLAMISKDCSICHTETAWKPSTFNHSLNTTFPLNGAHLKADCLKCHISNFANTTTFCVNCHLNDYMAAKNPNHVQANFSKECLNCHTTSGRSPSKFDHNTYTTFPLKGSHIGVDCKACHANQYKGRSTACVSCHLKKYNATVYPNHVQGNFSKECQNCHNDKDWKQSLFNHNTNTAFPLTGLHTGLDCKKCHETLFSGTSSECYSCHKNDYVTMLTNSRTHQAVKYPTSCKNCHTTEGFKKTKFNHDKTNFPIYSNKHKGVWVTCNDCHTNLSNFEEISCIKCHAHDDQQKSDSIHHNVINYSYSAKSCFVCHPKGKK